MSEKESSEESEAEARKVKSWIIMVVDDQLEVRNAVLRELVKKGIPHENIICVWDDIEALHKLKRRVKEKKRLPDFILLDLWMHDDLYAGVRLVEKIMHNRKLKHILEKTVIYSTYVYSKILMKDSEYEKEGIRKEVIERLKKVGIPEKRIIAKQDYPPDKPELAECIITFLKKHGESMPQNYSEGEGKETVKKGGM